jgi:hypothetical protein
VQDVSASDNDEQIPSRPTRKDTPTGTSQAADKSVKKRKIAPSQNDTTIKIDAVKDIPDETLQNVMFVALRHHSARLICNNPYPGQDAEKELIISSFAAGKKDFGASEYKLTKPLQKLVSLSSLNWTCVLRPHQLRNNKSTFRGRIRDAAQHFVPGEYGLASLTGDALQAEKRRLLHNFAYMYKVCEHLCE